LIALREQYGVFRSNALVWPMSSDSCLVPRVAGEVQSYYVTEGVAITPADMTLNQLGLTARKLACLTIASNELQDDAILEATQIIVESMAVAMALEEDRAGFLGDGTAAFGGIVGLASALAAGSKQTATARQTCAALTLADFEGCIGKARQWAGANPKWFISQQGWANSMQRLLNAAGGNTLVTLAQGATKTFLGYEVVISQTLESRTSGTTGLPALYFGDLRQSAIFGSRRGVSVAVDQSRYFESDAVAIRCTERFDINCHDRGDASNSGGLVQLVFG